MREAKANKRTQEKQKKNETEQKCVIVCVRDKNKRSILTISAKQLRMEKQKNVKQTQRSHRTHHAEIGRGTIDWRSKEKRHVHSETRVVSARKKTNILFY